MTRSRTASGSPEERGEEGSDTQDRLFSLPGGNAALFLLHEFDNPNLVERIEGHGGQVTYDEASADVILTRSRDEYKTLKDRYAISRKTHVRMSGFVDRCIDASRFVLAPTPGKGTKGIPGRIPGARRIEFTEDDDEHLCQYIAEILPEKGKGGRTGHFIYSDLMRRADQYGQYIWAQRHTKNAWRERYRKHQARLDQRITAIVEENPPAPDGKGQYRFRRLGKLDPDDEDAEEFLLDAEAVESPTDDEDDPVLVKQASPQPQEEEEDGEEEQHPAGHQSEDEVRPRDEDSYHEEEEDQDAQTARRRPKARRITYNPPAPKRRKAKQAEEAPSPNDPDLTLLGPDDEVDQLAQEYDIPADADIPPATKQSSPPVSPSEPEPTRKRVTRQTPSQARPAAPPSPPRTRARSRLHATNAPPAAPTPTRRRAAPRAKATTTARRARSLSVDDPVEESARKAKAKKSGAAVTTLDAVAESDSHVNTSQDEFVAHSESEEESDMQEVEVNLRVSAGGAPRAARNLSPDDQQTSKRLRRARGAADEDEEDEDEDEDDSDAELFARVKKLDMRPPPTPAKARRRTNLNKDEDSEPDEDVRPPVTRAASAMKGKGKAREAAPRRRN